MFKTLVLSAALVLLVGESAWAQAPQGAGKPSDAVSAPSAASSDSKKEAPGGDAKTAGGKTKAPAADGKEESLLGISILGNKEAPKSLVIVPWKSSEIGKGLGVSRALDTSIRPVDKDVFARELEYYELRAKDEKK